MAYKLEQIRRLVTDAFNSDQVITLAFDRFRPVHNEFSDGMPKQQMVLLIVDYAHKHGKIETLLGYIEQENSHQYSLYKDKLRENSTDSIGAVPTGTTDGDTKQPSDMHKLLDGLKEEQEILSDYDRLLTTETDPRERRKLERKRDFTKERIKELNAKVGTRGSVEAERAVTSNLPRLPFFVGRQQELATIAEALAPETRSWGVLIDGPGGIGKTTLAIQAADLAPAADFDNKIFLSAKVRELTPSGEEPIQDFQFTNFMALLNELAHELGEDQLDKIDAARRPRTVLRALAGENSLLVIDNLETFAEKERVRLYQFLRQLPPGCKVIVTSRRRNDIDVRTIRLDRMLRDDAMGLMDELAHNNGRLQRATQAERDKLYEITNGNPLLIKWLVGQLGRSQSQCRTIADACAFLEKAPKNNDPLEYIFGDLLDTFTPNEEKVLTALVHFKQMAKLKWIADVADIAETAALTGCEDLADRALLVSNEDQTSFFLPLLAASFLRRKRPEAVGQTADRLTDRVFALIFENGYRKHDRFPTLEAEWETVEAALPLLEQWENRRFQRVCDALKSFLNFSGRWDISLELSKQGEAKAVATGDFYNAGWRVFQISWVCILREDGPKVLDCAERCAEHWEKTTQAGGREQSIVLRLQGMGHRLAENYPAAVEAYEKMLKLRRAINPESDDVAIGLNDLAAVKQAQKEHQAAEKHLREALRIAKKTNYMEGIAYMTGNLAELANDQEHWAEGERLARESLPLAEKVGRQELIGSNCERIAKALAKQGKAAEGLPYAQRAVEIFTYLKQPTKLKEAQEALELCGG